MNAKTTSVCRTRAKMLILSLAASTLLTLFPGRAGATGAPPERMTYQGYLVDANGVVLGQSTPANFTVIFRVYDASQGGSALWTEQQVVTVDNGLFSVVLGEGSQFQSEGHGSLSGVFNGTTADARWIGITVMELGGNEIAPRLRLLTSPYAFLASSAANLSSGGSSFISKSGDNVSVAGDLRVNSQGTELVMLPRTDEVVIGNSRDVPTRIAGNLRVARNGRTMEIDPAYSGGHTRFTHPGGNFIFNGMLEANEDGGWGQFNPNADNLEIRGSGKSIVFRNPSGTFQIDPIDGGHTRFYNSSGGYIFNGFLHTRDRDNAANWFEMVPGSGYARLQTSGSRIILRNGAGGELAIHPNEGGHPEIRGTESQVLIYRGRGLEVNKSGRYLVLEPNVSGVTQFRSADSSFELRDDSPGVLGLDPKNSRDLTEIRGNQGGFEIASAHRSIIIAPGQSEIVFGQFSSPGPVPWRFADHDLRVDLDFFARGVQRFSDRRLKKDIEPMEEKVLDRITKLRPVLFHWKEEESSKAKTLGFIAQEVQEVFPDSVKESDGTLSINSDDLTTFTVAGLQELKSESDARIKSLEDENDTLKEQLKVVLERLQALEKKVN